MSTRSDHDVLILGGGPAGSQLALRLAQAGHDVALAEARHFPRAKPCGEFMSPACLPLLDELGLRAPLVELGARRVRGMRIHGYGHHTGGHYGGIARIGATFDHGLAVRREVLDTRLFQEVRRRGEVRVLEGWRASHLLRGAGGRVEGATLVHPERGALELRARVTVGADGRQSTVARELGTRSFDPRLRRHAVVVRYRGVEPLDQGEAHLFPGGYFACAPVDDGQFTLNLVVPDLPGGREGLEPFLAACLDRAPVLRARLAHAERVGAPRVCGPLAVRTRSRTFDGAALVGDAAGFVDPLTGEGLYFAMRGAQLLAQTLDGALRRARPTRADLRDFERTYGREIGRRHRLARWLQRGVARPGLTARALALLEAWPGLAELVVDLTGDHLGPGDLLDPRTWWRTRHGHGAVPCLAPRAASPAE